MVPALRPVLAGGAAGAGAVAVRVAGVAAVPPDRHHLRGAVRAAPRRAVPARASRRLPQPRNAAFFLLSAHPPPSSFPRKREVGRVKRSGPDTALKLQLVAQGWIGIVGWVSAAGA